MSSSRTVTIGVPVYHGEEFLAETLEAIITQTHQDFRVIIALDGPQTASEAVCAPFLEDSRFTIRQQPERLGWVGNLNWLYRQVETPYWCYQQQDDLIAPTYLETLVDYAERTPQAAVVYSDMIVFGALQGSHEQTSILGGPAVRQIALLTEHFPAVAFRGLTRVEALREMRELRTNEVNNFSVENAWMCSVARWGELHRVPQALYRKRYHGGNESRTWRTWAKEKRRRGWLVHCADMLQEAITCQATPQERRLIFAAAVGRLAMPHTPEHYLYLPELTQGDRRALLTEFLQILESRRDLDLPALLDTDAQGIWNMAQGFYWVPPARDCGPTLLKRAWRKVMKRR